MTSPSVREVALDPEWLPHAFEPDGRNLTSVFVPNARRKELVFLTDGQFRENFRKVTLPVAAIADEARAATEAPLHFIFHSSFCCSTLLSKALDVEGAAASLSEPNVLVNVAEHAIRSGVAATQPMLELGLRLLARPLGNREAVILKPSSFANRLIQPILDLRSGSRGVLLYSDAATFLGSVVRRGLLGRINARKLYQNLANWTSLDFGFSAAEIFEQTDLQIAGLAWLMQIAHFNEIAARFGSERVLVLDAAGLMADPAAELQRVQSFFNLRLDDEQIGTIVAGPIFSKHSKFTDRDYDSTARERDRDALMQVHAEELGMVLEWLKAVAAHMGVPLGVRVA
jgi:hypothetical protein